MGQTTAASVEDRPGPAASAFNLADLSDSYFENPYPWFRALRDHDPLHRNADGSVLVTRYEDVKAIWRDPSGQVDKTAVFTAKFGQGPLLEHHTSTILFRDGADHDRLRALVSPFFSNRSVTAHTGFVDDAVTVLLGQTAARPRLDGLADYANRLPIAVICRILGVPHEDGDHIQSLGRRILFALNPAIDPEDVAAGHSAAQTFRDYILEHVARTRAEGEAQPDATLISALVWAQRQGAAISDVEIAHMCILTLNGGHETTTNLIAGSISALIDFPDQQAVLRNPEVTPHEVLMASEELTRFVTPLQLQGRRTTHDVAVSAGSIPAGTEVILCQASANRDERVFADPETLNLKRSPNAHLAFGVGNHACVGRPLARLEASIAVTRFIQRFRTIERTGPVVFNRNARFRGMAQFPITVSET